MPPQAFGRFKLRRGCLFFETPLTFASVNLKPLVPGHVLVCPKRVVPRFHELTPEEVSDLFLSTQIIARALEPHYGTTAANIAIQDGADAGQTVPHVHVHVLPRKVGDFARNDDVYEELDNMASSNREPRSAEAMIAEATELRRLFPAHTPADD